MHKRNASESRKQNFKFKVMTDSVHVVTFSDKHCSAIDNLKADCKKTHFPFTVLGLGEKWESNTLKLRLLKDFIQSKVKEDILLVIDAFDVRITGSGESIQEKISQLECDVLFGAEANYYFRDKELSHAYWNKYPRDGTYHYLNSGTLLGKSSSILQLIDGLTNRYEIDLGDNEQLCSLISDQYLYSRYYVDTKLDGANELNISIDTEQSLFGCSGGAMGVVNWPVFNMLHQYCFFREERKLIKTFHLRPYQIKARDLVLKQQQIVNTRTGESPDIIHLPGTHQHFDLAWNYLNKRKMSLKWYVLRLFAVNISFIAYLMSIVKFFTSAKPTSTD